METLKCKSCGGSLEIREPAGVVRCSRCGRSADEPPARLGSESPLRNFVLRVYCRVLIVLIIYVLSTGPMYWLIYEAFNTNQYSFLARLYYPIAVVCQYSDLICNWFDWYVGLWVY